MACTESSHGSSLMPRPRDSHGSSMRVLFIEPFYGGSHRQLVDLLLRACEGGGALYSLPASKWHWRMRVSALHFATVVPESQEYKTLFASSVLNLCELLSLRPDLAPLRKVLYFHENQLVYPVRKHQERDFQYGYNQILSCLVADVVLFNSQFNMESFLGSIDSFLRLMPDNRPRGLAQRIRPKCRVLYFPIELPHSDITITSTGRSGHAMGLPSHQIMKEKNGEERGAVLDSGCEPKTLPPPGDLVVHSETIIPAGIDSPLENQSGSLVATKDVRRPENEASSLECTEITTPEQQHEHYSSPGNPKCTLFCQDPRPLHILWPHRWEHDKGPEEFCSVLVKLLEAGFEFRVSILGSHTKDIPAIFQTTIPLLGARVLHQGHIPRPEYWDVLHQADVVVSTAKHEFFGVAMLEAVHCGCYPLCPNRLVYPEIYPSECLYNTEQQLFKRLRRFCQKPWLARSTTLNLSIDQFKWETLQPRYIQLLNTTKEKSTCSH